MTDVMSETFGRALVARTAFEQEAVWLPLLATHHLNAGEPVLHGKTFTDCVIEGPALVAPLQNTRFEGCNMGDVTDPRSLLFKPLGPVLAGAIGLDACTFVRCRFVQVAFSGSDEFLAQMSDQLISARQSQR